MEIVKEEKTPGILRDAGEDWVTMWISRMVKFVLMSSSLVTEKSINDEVVNKE